MATKNNANLEKAFLRKNLFGWMIGAVLLLLCKTVVAQSYLVTITATSGSPQGTPKTYYISGPFGAQSSSTTSSFEVPSLPTSFKVDFYNSFNFSTCTVNGTITSSSICGAAGTGGSGSFCFGSTTSPSISLIASPKLSITGTVPGTFCEDQTVTLNGTSGFGNYTWYYKVQSGLWTAFTTNTNYNYTFGIQDVFGANYTQYLNQTIYFGYGISGCGIGAYLPSGYIFAPYPPFVGPTQGTDYSIINPTCANGTGQLIVNALNRPLRPNEKIVISLYDAGSLTATLITQSPQSDNLSISISGLVPMTYYALVESYVYPDGSSSGVKTPCPSSLTFRSFTIIAPPVLSTSGSVTSQVSCYGGSDGQIKVTGSGGSGNFLYSINGGSSYQSNNIFSNLPTSNNYVVKIRESVDANCTVTGPTLSISSPSQLTPGTFSVVHPTCSGSSTGAISIDSPSGGSPPYQYSVDGGSNFFTSPLFSSISPGTAYSILTKDNHSCTVYVGSGTINQPVSASYASVVASCSTVNDGTITVYSSGGTGSYQYSLNGGPYQSSNLFSGLASGSGYSVSTKDGNGCTYSLTNASVGLKAPSLAANPSQISSINCFGQSTATLTANPSGGTAPYANYSWSNGATVFSVSQTVGSLPAGSYSLAVTDSKGCQNTSSIVVNQPSQLMIGVPLLSDFNTYNISCKGGSNGSISVTPLGGTPGYTYSWSTGTTSQNVSGLTAGNYSVTVTDVKGCGVSKNFTLSEPPSSVSASLQSKSDITCFGANNGVIMVTASGGVGAISYSRDNWASSQASATFSALAPTTYTIYARDLNNCATSTSPVTIFSPTALTISSIIKNDPLCNGEANGSFSLTSSGGTAPYQFSNGGAFSISSTFSGLAAGSYVLSVKDGNGCTTSSAIQMLSDPALLVLSASTIPQSCHANVDGSITLNGIGGTSPYTFSIDGGTTYGSNTIFSGLTSGIYSSVIKDNHGCVTAKPVAVNIQPQLLGSIALSSSISCFGQTTGGLSLNVSGGTSPYSFLWSNGSTLQDINALPAGNYSVAVTDSRNCTTSQNTVVDQPTQLSLSSTNSNYNGYGVSCQNSTDGFINVSSSGGTSPYTYAWTTGATTSTIAGLASGTYTVSVTDSKNCTASLPVSLTVPTALSSTLDAITNVTCNGGNDGLVTVSTSGGVANYEYSLDGLTWQPSATFSSLSASPYVVQVKDGNNCTATSPFNITQPSAVAINIAQIQDAGCNLSNGSIQSSATGGTGALNYIWKDASSNTVSASANLINAPSGIYLLTVTDQSQCATSTTVAISNPEGPAFSIVNQVAASCSYTNDGQAKVLITTGPSPHIVSWNNGEAGTSALQLSAGTSSVTVTDGNNCSTIQTFTTASPSSITLASQQSNSPRCPNGNDGSIQVVVSGGTSPYHYTWNGNNGSSLLSDVSAGSYSLIVTDANGCIHSQNIDVADIPPIVVNVLNQISPLCSSSADGSVFVQASGGNGSFKYSWDDGRTGAQLNSVAAGVYTVAATDSKNCLQQKTIGLTAPSPISESLTTSAALCYAGNSGTIIASSTGGVGGYAFSKDNGGVWQSQNVFEGLTAGKYSILTKDQNGCSASSQAIIDEPPAITITISKIDPTCGQLNGFAQATITGGTGSYKYQWSNDVGQPFGNSTNLQLAPSDVYTLNVADANNCLSSKGVVLASYPSAQFSVANVAGTSCSYLSDGTAGVQITSVQLPYAISWSSGETSSVASGLTAGSNTITLTDVNNCKFTKTFQVPSPLPINLISETVINPVCAGGVGSIQVTPSGGTGNFTYKWNGDLGTNNIQNVKAGSYSLTIRDANGCAFPKNYALTDPPLFEISLGNDQTICPHSTASLGITLPNATYQWSGPSGFASTQGNINAAIGGTYQLAVTNSDGCKASDEIVISISNNLLKADFLTVSKAHVGDTLAIIDISWPIPDQVNWQLSNEAAVIYADNDYALITFSKPGDFKIGLTATEGGCQDEYYQIVSIVDLPSGGEAKHIADDPEVSSIVAYPNPFVGKTNARIELHDSGTAILKVYSMVTNSLIMAYEFQGDKTYNAEIDFNGREAGLYFIIVQSGSKTKAIRVIKL